MTTRLITTLAAVLVGWLAVLALVSVMSDEAPAYVVVFPSARVVHDLPRGVSVVESSAFSITLASDQPGLARALYQSGALLVLPSGLSGCAPTRSAGGALLPAV